MIALVDYGVGNINSVMRAFEVAGADIKVTKDADDLKKAEKIVLPGVGAFAEGMENLRASGLIPVLAEEVLAKKKPCLGLCLGMQMMCRQSMENGVYAGLGWIPAEVRPLSEFGALRVPHVGWNEIVPVNKATLFDGIGAGTSFYFVHSYHVVLDSQKDCAATCTYGKPFAASFEHANLFGTQFHPEKSQSAGLQLIKNFLKYKR